MTVSPVEWGTPRQVWLAPVATPASKTPFLVRDDAYSIIDAGSGRQYRLGDPITTGPAGVWHQRTWEGGTDQDNWADEEMFLSGPVDPTLRPGKVQLWPGWKEIISRRQRLVGRYLTMPSPDGFGEDTSLIIAESQNEQGLNDPVTGTEHPDPDYRIYRYKNGSLTTLKTFSDDSPIMAMTDIEQENASSQQEKFLVGLKNGKVYRYNVDTDVWSHEHTMKHDKVNSNAMCAYGGYVFIGTKWQLSKRDWDPDNGAKYTVVKKMPWLTNIENFVVWNNRLWFTGRTTGGGCHLLVSDGVTVTEAFEMTGSFRCTKLVVHYGSLYLLGMRNNQPGFSQTTSEVWRYNGSSLTKVWEEDPYTEATESLELWDGCSWRQYLVWGRTGAPSIDRLPGLMLYDAELDAVIEGPCFDMSSQWDNSAHISGICVWSNTLVCAALDRTAEASYTSGGTKWANGVFHLRKGKRVDSDITGFSGHSFGPSPHPDVIRKLYSSVYDAELPGQEKVWLNARVRCKVPQNTRILLKAVFDENGTEQTVSTITYNGSDTWRNEVIPFKVSGDYTTSTRLQYILQLENTDPATSTTANPQVDSVSIEWVPKALVRNQWRLRALASDAQVLLDGSAHPQTTALGIFATLGSLYAAGKPVLYWDAATNGTTPVIDGTEVLITDFTVNAYRLNSVDSSTVYELALTLTEVS
jgi:hypothetical protein